MILRSTYTSMDVSNPMVFRSSALSLLTRLQHGLSHAELVHVPHPFWPLRPNTAAQSLARPVLLQHIRPLRISVLDASFNPPTLAHLALINAPRPSSASRDLNCEGKVDDDDNRDYDARLLLLSVRNVDKTLKPTDATYVQRLEMMRLLTQHVRPTFPTSSDAEAHANVAVGIIDEPTFVGKSTRLLDFLSTHLRALSQTHSSLVPPSDKIPFELSFILGLDTLERLVSPRYYPSEAAMLTSLRHFLSPMEENSIVVCARRKLPSAADPPNEEDKLVVAREFIDTGRVRMIDIGEDESTYSSTAVRTAIKELGLDEESQSVWRRYVPTSVADYIVNEKLYVG